MATEREKWEATCSKLVGLLHYQEMELDNLHQELVDVWEELENCFLEADQLREERDFEHGYRVRMEEKLERVRLMVLGMQKIAL